MHNQSRRSPDAGCRESLAGDHQIDCFGAFALLVGLNIITNPLTFVQHLEPRLLDGRDVYEHVAPAVVRLDKAVSSLAVEELDRTGRGHRESSSPRGVSPPAPAARRLGRTFQS